MHKVLENRKYTEWPPESPEAFNFHKYPVYTEYSSLRLQFHYVSLYDQPFSRYKIVENWKCTKWPNNDLNHLSVKSTLYTLNTHTLGPNFNPFALRPAIFKILVFQKSEMNPMTPEWP